MAECLHFPDEEDKLQEAPEELPFGAIEEDKDNVTCKAPLSFGYDENFISPVDDDLQCSICFLPLREPVLTRCGHRFCRECLEHHMTRQESLQQVCNCPVDREEIDFLKDIFPDKATARKIHSLVIKCLSAGCEWTGELREKEGHLLTCSFKLISCMNANCEVTTTRKDLDEHMNSVCQWRIVSCEHCSEPHPFCQLQDHADNCKKKPVRECPNGCGELIVAEEIASHVNDECPLTEISCPYAQMGCNTKIQRKEVESHLQSTTTLHLDLTCATLKKTTERLEQTAIQVQELKAANSTLSSKVYAQDIEISKLRREYTTFVWKVDDFNEVLEDAKTGVSVYVQSVPFYTGKQGYKLRVRIYPDGDQSNRNRYLSVFLVLMEGKFDGILSWPFHQKVTFTLVDQNAIPEWRNNVVASFNTDSSWSFSERPSVGENEEMCGILRFVSHRNLQGRRYIYDDALFLQVNIDPPDPSVDYDADFEYC